MNESMGWKLFLDDERDPVGNDWVICRNISEAVAICNVAGLPSYINFDHDLSSGKSVNGFENSGMGFAKWMINECLDGRHEMPMDFDWYVHSQNPVGAENINKLLTNWMSFKD